MKIFLVITFFLFSSLYGNNTKEVSLKLSWLYQFQFAGYIMAKEKGFYDEVDLNVDIKEVSNQTMNERDDFTVRKSSVLIDKMDGKKIVALGATFQHSPMMLLVLESSKINSPKDLLGKKVMVTKDAKGSAAIIAMLNAFKLDSSNVEFIPHSFHLEDLIEGKTDAMACYISNEPLILDKLGIKYKMLKPDEYGFDFYEDLITVDQEFLNKNPKVVQNFYDATIKGWDYAFSHIEESAQIIFSKYNTQNKTLGALVDEGKILKTIAYDPNNRLGTLNDSRLSEMENVFKVLGLSKNNLNIKEFVYEHNSPPTIILDLDNHVKIMILIISISFLMIVGVVIYYTRKLRQEINSKKIAQEEAIIQKDFVQKILDKMENIVLVSDVKTQKIIMANNELFRFLNLTNTAEFRSKYNCICDLFIEHEDYLQKENNGIYWIDYLLQNRDKVNKVMIKQQDKKFLFSVYTEYLDKDRNMVISVFTDITNLKANEDKVSHNLKIEALMEMISNIAHHWRQPLTLISTLASTTLLSIEMETSNNEKVSINSQKILDTANELSLMLDIFKDKMGENNENKTKILLEDILLHIKSFFMQQLANNNIAFYLNINENCKKIEVSELFFNVLKEIIQNSIDALEHSNNLNKKSIFFNIEKKQSELVFDIYDNANGIDEGIIGKIFEPYFTTYHQSKGKGLGLYFVQNSVKNFLFGDITAQNKKFQFEKEQYQGLETIITIDI